MITIYSLYFSDSGWTDTYNCERWIRDIFIPFAKQCRVDNTKPIVLTMDGHDTHEKPEIQRAIYDCLDNEDLEIVILCFPSKTTHKCQPLDVLVFSAVERRWQEICADYLEKGKPMNRHTVIPAYIQGTWEVMTKELIAKAFEKTGLHPVNRQVFTEEDFAPSRASSTMAHVPNSFPLDVPSSDPAELSHDDMDSDPDDDNFIPSDLESNNDDEEAVEPVSGITTTLASLEVKIIHMTRSATARLELFNPAPPKAISMEEDQLKSSKDLLNELRSVRQQLHVTHKALQFALGQLSASNAHCTSIHWELSSIREQLNNATKARERGLKKIKARFVTSQMLCLEFKQEEAE